MTAIQIYIIQNVLILGVDLFNLDFNFLANKKSPLKINFRCEERL